MSRLSIPKMPSYSMVASNARHMISTETLILYAKFNLRSFQYHVTPTRKLVKIKAYRLFADTSYVKPAKRTTEPLVSTLGSLLSSTYVSPKFPLFTVYSFNVGCPNFYFFPSILFTKIRFLPPSQAPNVCICCHLLWHS